MQARRRPCSAVHQDAARTREGVREGREPAQAQRQVRSQGDGANGERERVARSRSEPAPFDRDLHEEQSGQDERDAADDRGSADADPALPIDGGFGRFDALLDGSLGRPFWRPLKRPLRRPLRRLLKQSPCLNLSRRLRVGHAYFRRRTLGLDRTQLRTRGRSRLSLELRHLALERFEAPRQGLRMHPKPKNGEDQQENEEGGHGGSLTMLRSTCRAIAALLEALVREGSVALPERWVDMGKTRIEQAGDGDSLARLWPRQSFVPAIGGGFRAHTGARRDPAQHVVAEGRLAVADVEKLGGAL